MLTYTHLGWQIDAELTEHGWFASASEGPGPAYIRSDGLVFKCGLEAVRWAARQIAMVVEDDALDTRESAMTAWERNR